MQNVLRELALAAALIVAAGMIVRGVAGWNEQAALIVAGLLLGALAVLFLAEAD